MRDAVFDKVVEMVMKRGGVSPGSSSSAAASFNEGMEAGQEKKEEREGRKEQTGTGTGLEPLASEIRQLVERLAKLAVLHLNVYQTVYEQNCVMVREGDEDGDGDGDEAMV